MIEVNALLFTLLAEATVLLSIILIVWIVITIRKKGKDKAAAKALVDSIKLHSGDRLDSITSILSSVSDLEGDGLLKASKRIDRLEKELFTQIVRLHLKRDNTILAVMDEYFDKVIAGYKENISVTASSASDTAVDEGAQDKIDGLEKEKESLIVELKITKATMGNMMAEFNTVFNGGNETIKTSKDALQSTMAVANEGQPQSVSEPTVSETAVESVKEDSPTDDVETATAPEPIDDSGMEDVFLSADAEEDSKETAVTDADAPKPIDESGMEDVLFSVDDEPSSPKKSSKADDDFGSIVSTDDVDDLLAGIDLSEEIDVK